MIGQARSRLHDLALRIEAATPAHRDRTVDGLRALAILGVILGHWLVTALVLNAGKLHDASPLSSMPALTPVSWIFQTLAIFFFVGGFSAARSYHGGYRAWLGKRLARLSRPVVALAAVWALLGTALYLGGVSSSILHTVLVLVLDPLWFLGVYAGLTALTPLAVSLVRRFGAGATLIPLAAVAIVDAVRFALGGPAWAGYVNLAAGWLVPYLLGIAWARGSFASRKLPALMLAGGAAATAALVVWAGYPASMVGVNGSRISNLNPPTLAVVTFGIAQVGLALLLRDVLARWMRRPAAWAAVALVNLSAMTLFLWHQTAFLTVTMGGLLIGRLPGLHTPPASPLWVVERIAWLPLFATTLAVLWLVFHRAERAPRPRRADHRPAGRDSEPSGEQVPLRGTFLPLGRAPGPEHGRETGPGHPAPHLIRRQPVDVEFDAQAGAVATAPKLAVAGLERGHQVASRLDHPGKFAEGGRPIRRRQVHEGVPANHARQRSILERQAAQVGNAEIEAGIITPGHPDHAG
jgi:fucose 4-O-acetylase-like acetyltransferase